MNSILLKYYKLWYSLKAEMILEKSSSLNTPLDFIFLFLKSHICHIEHMSFHLGLYVDCLQ